jgi:hypothetical protein
MKNKICQERTRGRTLRQMTLESRQLRQHARDSRRASQQIPPSGEHVEVRDTGKKAFDIHFYERSRILMDADVIQDAFALYAAANIFREMKWLQ